MGDAGTVPTLDALNAASPGDFAAMLRGVYGPHDWVVERAAAARPFASHAHLARALVEVVRAAGPIDRLALIRAHADGGGARSGAGGLPSPGRWGESRAAYEARFGFPFVLAEGGPRGLGVDPATAVATLERRLRNPPDVELDESLRNVHRIAALRLDDALGLVPELGDRAWDWAQALAAHSEPGYAERGQLTVTYLGAAHRACAAQLARWMRDDCGFDEVAHDAVGNVVARYHGTDPGARRLLTGSHYDTVRNAGRYDGRLGILVPMACVRELRRQGRRLPFGIELVAFAEEEGQRFRTAFLGSSALAGSFDPAWLDQTDADGVTLRAAMAGAGLRVEDVARLRRDPADYLGFVEIHIEQGPVLDGLDLPLGVVTSINGSVRLVGEVTGQASHAGTTPMGRRRDAAAAVAELVLYVERRAAAEPDLVGTVGMLGVPQGSVNVVPGRCEFSLDLRATTDAARDACVADVRAELASICERRGVSYRLEETMRVPAAPSDPGLRGRWERAVAALGLPVHCMPSGAGHDAMRLHAILPQAMLFVRGWNGGISHNPLEEVGRGDADLAARAFLHLLGQLAEDPR